MANRFQSTQYNFGGKELNLRLDAKAIIQIENTLGKGITEIIFAGSEQRMAPVSELLTVLQACETKHGLKRNDMIPLFQKHLENGKGYPDILEVVGQVIEESGFFGETEEDESEMNEDSSEEQDELNAKIEE